MGKIHLLPGSLLEYFALEKSRFTAGKARLCQSRGPCYASRRQSILYGIMTRASREFYARTANSGAQLEAGKQAGSWDACLPAFLQLLSRAS
jgi:hypothetical protein